MVLSDSVSDTIKSHVYCSRSFCFALLLTMMLAAILSVAASAGGCWWPISARAVLMDVAFWKFPNKPPNYAYMSDVITFLIMLHSTCTGPFYGGINFINVLDSGPRKKYLPALPCASCSNMYDASE